MANGSLRLLVAIVLTGWLGGVAEVRAAESPATKPASGAGAAVQPAATRLPAPGFIAREKPSEKPDEPAQREATWMARHQSMAARAAQGGVDLLFLGDFTTEGWHIGGKHGGGARGKKVWAAYYEQLSAASFGIRGDKTQHLLYRITHGELDGITPKAVVVLIGSANLASNTPEEAVGGVQAVVKEIRRKLPETHIVLMGLLPWRFRPTDRIRTQIAQVNEGLAKLDDGKSVFYVDLTPKLVNEKGQMTAEISDDGINLTPKGYTIWAEAINPKLEEWLGRKIEPQAPVRAKATRPAGG